MKKPELLVTPTSVADIEPLIKAGADAFIIGEQRYALRLPGEFTREDVKEVIQIAHAANKKVYVSMNALFHNEKVDELEEYIAFLKEAGVDRIVWGDPAVLMAVRTAAPDMPLHWNTEMTVTNWYTANYWGRRGSVRAVVAREINMDAVIEMKEHAEVEIEVQVHGMTCMFQSKRTLLGNYFEYQGKSLEVENRTQQRNMFLHDKERENKYPIYEDENGTHIMSPNDICMIDELQELVEADIDSFKIDGILKTPEYIIEITKLYRQAIDLCVEDVDRYDEMKSELFEKIEAIQPKNRALDTGFFFKETVY
ncbi:peptidase U32 family protein [Peribacillus asahii]|uniref:peptidase U32 family protein n=1 Tax=Peribacillus asahii TaxID=228899 RepID=UPI00207A3C30|nr:peptidase U32 family protein [Peribacillus asahii]USK84181.1 U32 family peptidase [Peribacillus asahii]